MKKTITITLCCAFFMSNGMDQGKNQKIHFKSSNLEEQTQFTNVYQKNLDLNNNNNPPLLQPERQFDINNNNIRLNPSSFQPATENTDADADYNLDLKLVQSVLKASPEARAIIEMIRFPERFDKFEHFWIFFGPPGVGKSVLAQAIAIKSNAKAKFVRCPALLDKYRNGTIHNLENLFKKILSTNNKTIVILDEFNALFENYKSKNNDSAETAASFWTLFDSIRYHPNLFLIGTSNRLSEVPIQLKTRIFDLIVIIENNDTGMVNIINYFIEKYRCLPDCTAEVVLALIKKEKDLSSPRAIGKLFQLAAKQATLKNGDNLLSKKHIESAYEKIKYILHNVLKIEYEPESERERQERHHKENMEKQEKIAFEQRLLQVNIARRNEAFAQQEHHKQVKEEANGSWYASLPFGSIMGANAKLKINKSQQIKEEFFEDNAKIFDDILYNQETPKFEEPDESNIDEEAIKKLSKIFFRHYQQHKLSGSGLGLEKEAHKVLKTLIMLTKNLKKYNQKIKKSDNSNSNPKEINKEKEEVNKNQKKESCE